MALLAGLLLGSGGPARAVDPNESTEPVDLTAVRAMIRSKEFRMARDELLRLARDHDNADVFNLLGFSLRKTGDYTRALTYYEKALALDPNHKGALEYLGELYVETKQPDKAREQLAVLVRLCPKGCEERGDLEEAMTKAGIALKKP